MDRKALTSLRALTTIEERAARNALRRAADAEAALAAEAQELDAMRRTAIASEGLDGPRRMAGADAAWQTWLGMRRVSVLSAQARARAELAATRDTALCACGRARMAERLEREAFAAGLRKEAETDARRIEAFNIMQRSMGVVRRPDARSR